MPTPLRVSGDFTVGLGDVISGRTHRELLEELDRLEIAEAADSGFCSWVRWVEYET